MCGLAGYLWNAPREPLTARAAVARMCGNLGHRGPDSQGVIAAPFVRAGFQRLAIVDLEHGDQPATTRDGSIEVVFNGEIYNHHELRRDLTRRGHRFSNGSDTEVLPALYREYGLDFARHLNGMFSICIVDRDARRIVLVRDRLGIKPLYIARVPSGLLFASEMKSLLASGLVSRRLDPASFVASLNFYYSPGHHTLVEGVHKLMPGTMLVADAGGAFDIKQWYRLPAAPASAAGPADPDEIDALLFDAVRIRTVADVPVAIGLSGGLDSSLLAAYAARSAPGKVTAFTSVCADAPDDELPTARLVAKHLGLEHVVIPASCSDYLSEAATMVWHADEPVTDPAFQPALKLAEAACSTAKVLLLGAGADELFAGYRHYQIGIAHHVFARLPGAVRTGVAMLAERFCPHRSDRIDAIAQLAHSRLPAHVLAMSKCTPFERRMLGRQVLTHRDPLACLRASFQDADACDPLNQQLYADMLTYLPEQVLPMFDRTTMAHSIEGRVPFLDHRVVEHMFAVHGRYKDPRRGAPKQLLRDVARQYLPPQVLQRKKSGFPSPVFRWLREDLAPVLRHALGRQESLAARYLPRGWVHDRCATPDAIAAHAPMMHTLLMLEIWNELFIVRGCTETPDIHLHDLFEMAARPAVRRAA